MQNQSLKPLLIKYSGIGTTVLALVCLILGISMPCIQVSSHLLGFIPIGTERSSIFGLIVQLYQSNFLLALVITLFSIIIPVSKLSLTLIMILSDNKQKDRSIDYLVHNIGKWSMVDVFCMAITVTVLSFNNLKINIFSTQGELLIGFYFFLAYGLLSVATTYLLNMTKRINVD